jgi:predicted PurR-regulated permease PerM
VKENLEDTVLYVLEAFVGVEYTFAFLLLLVWARMLFIAIGQATQHLHPLKRDRRRRFVHSLPSHLARVIVCCAVMGSVALLAAPQTPRQATEQPHADPPLPDIRRLVQEVQEHQKQLDNIRESYTYTSMETGQDIDANGQVKKTETEESEVSFVNGHIIARRVKKNGQRSA